MTRAELFDFVCGLIGSPPIISATARDGWPGVIELLTSAGPIRVALHVSNVSSHSRAIYEKRFQNPADSRPVAAPGGAIPMLLGVAKTESKFVFVAVDGASRVGRRARFSILFHDSVLTTAAKDGWSEYISSTDEHIYGLHPKLLPIFVEMLRDGVFVAPEEIMSAASASGVVDDDKEESAERARRVASQLVRGAAFSREVRTAYEWRCAMCGLSLGLVQGAHIFPASAPRSPDKVWNGLSLCHNHHAAFDKHYIWIDPGTHSIKLRPDILEIAKTDSAAKTFTTNTRTVLSAPLNSAKRPRATMFEKRYEFFTGSYDWIAH